MFVSSTYTQVSYVKRARTHRLCAWACVDVYFKQCISQVLDFIKFSKFPAKTIVTKLVGSCQQSKENMNVFVQTTKNTCLTVVVEQTFVVLHPGIAKISKFGFQKP